MGRRMSRGKQQVLLNYLPGKTFDFEKVAVIARVDRIRGVPRADLNARLILRAVEEQAVKVDQQTAHVVEKRAGVEVVQKLLDQQRRVHRQETLREQQVRLDELSAHRAARPHARPQTLQGDPS